MNAFNSKTPTLGVIYGNRDFFPDHLVTEARADIAKLFAKFGIKAIQLGETDSKLGGVETHNDARKCAELFRKHAGEIAGVLVCLPNFGDEKGVADTLKLSKHNVPVLIQSYPDDLKRLDVARRRDAFCGKISVSNNLVQAGIKFSLTSKHVSHPTSVSFEADLKNFLGVCRVVNGVRGVRLGAVGARPGAFNTVRYSENILERHGKENQRETECEITDADRERKREQLHPDGTCRARVPHGVQEADHRKHGKTEKRGTKAVESGDPDAGAFLFPFGIFGAQTHGADSSTIAASMLKLSRYETP